jgi:hypothetical protein
MFWSKKDKGKAKEPAQAPAKPATGSMTRSEQIRAEAMANARAAREAIGEETLQKIAAAIQKKQNSKIEQAKAQIKKADPGQVADEIIAMISYKK